MKDILVLLGAGSAVEVGVPSANGDPVIALGDKDRLARFEQRVLRHLDAAYNLAPG